MSDYKAIVFCCIMAGSGDVTEERRNGSHSLGGEHSLLVNGVQRGHSGDGPR